jgi:hypothetical protein
VRLAIFQCPGSGIRCLFLTPGSRIRDGEKAKIRIRDEHPGSYFRELREQFFGLKILKFFYSDPDPGSGIFLTLDPGSGMEIFGSRDPQTAVFFLNFFENIVTNSR